VVFYLATLFVIGTLMRVLGHGPARLPRRPAAPASV
jgi:hypothetical protein